MPKLKNNRHEKFAQAIFAGNSAAEAAREAGYAETGARQEGHRLLTNADIQNRIAELFKKSENAAIMSKQELAEMYTRMLKTLHADFLTMSADGVWFHDIGPETLHQEALKKVKTRIISESHGRGEHKVIQEKQFDEIELESKVSVGQALAKLMGYNEPDKYDLKAKVESEALQEVATDLKAVLDSAARKIAKGKA